MNANDRIYGALRSPDDERDYTLAPAAMAAAQPQQKKNITLYTPAVRDQGKVGSCVAHAAAAAGDYYERVKMSTDYIYGYRKARYQTATVGMQPRWALTTLLEQGNVPHDLLPTNTEMPAGKTLIDNLAADLADDAAKHKIEGYARIYTAAEVYASLAAGMPVLLATCVYSDFGASADGMLTNSADEEYLGNHAMLIYGCDGGNRFRTLNSWGARWGDGGSCWIPAEMLGKEDYVHELWALADTRAMDLIRRTLRYKTPMMRGDDVRELQTRLNGLGWPCGAADGIFGSKTRAAVCLFQRSKGLAADGIVGRLTWAALDSAR